MDLEYSCQSFLLKVLKIGSLWILQLIYLILDIDPDFCLVQAHPLGDLDIKITDLELFA